MDNTSKSSNTRQVRRALRRAHRDFYATLPKLNEALPAYIAATNINQFQEHALDAYFDGAVLQEGSGAAGTEDLESTNERPLGYSGSGHAVRLQQGAESTLLLDEIEVLPRYLFCRAADSTICRPSERFAPFYSSLIQDHQDFELLKRYKRRMWKQTSLCSQSEREPNADIIAREAYQRLIRDGADRRAIDKTRVLPIHSDLLEDLDLLRDLPSFPSSRLVGSGRSSVKRRAETWDDIPSVFSGTFTDNPDIMHLDADEKFCSWYTCRTFGCAQHDVEMAKPKPWDRSHLPPPVKLDSTSSLANSPPCCLVCIRAATASPTHQQEWSDPDLEKLADLLANQADIASCVLRPAFSAYTCREIHEAQPAALRVLRKRKQRALLKLPASLGKVDAPERSQGCRCRFNSTMRCRADSCACRRAARECEPDLCHPEEPDSHWESPLGEEGPDLGGKCCDNLASQYPQFNLGKMTRVGISPTAGYGLFALRPIEANTLLSDYVGEALFHDEAGNRLEYYNVLKRNYLFEIKGAVSEFVLVDAANLGNESRFINGVRAEQNNLHQVNCVAKDVVVGGKGRIVISTTKRIAAGQEILMCYGELFFGSKIGSSQVALESAKKKRVRRR